MGSFLRARGLLAAVPGVTQTELGYAGGFARSPRYIDVRRGSTGHAEVVRVTFDPDRTGVEALLRVFFDGHDPSQRLRQGVRVGTQYRSLLCWRTDEERELLAAQLAAERRRVAPRQLVTELAECDRFWPAEEDVASIAQREDSRVEAEHGEFLESSPSPAPGQCAGGAVELSVDGRTLRICLLPQHSAESVDYVRRCAAAAPRGCDADRCQFYRAESGFLLQGRMSPRGVVPNTVKGPCPEGVKQDGSRQCPAHDPNCGCHGPIMHRGMVGWAGGSAGPDFFIYAGKYPAVHWSHDHTVWGELADEASLQALEELIALPVHQLSPTNSMKMLDTPLSFALSIA